MLKILDRVSNIQIVSEEIKKLHYSNSMKNLIWFNTHVSDHYFDTIFMLVWNDVRHWRHRMVLFSLILAPGFVWRKCVGYKFSLSVIMDTYPVNTVWIDMNLTWVNKMNWMLSNASCKWWTPWASCILGIYKSYRLAMDGMRGRWNIHRMVTRCWDSLVSERGNVIPGWNHQKMRTIRMPIHMHGYSWVRWWFAGLWVMHSIKVHGGYVSIRRWRRKRWRVHLVPASHIRAGRYTWKCIRTI